MGLMQLPEDLRKRNTMTLNLKLLQKSGYLQEDSPNVGRCTASCRWIMKYFFVLLYTSFMLAVSVEIYRLRNRHHELGECIVSFISLAKSQLKIISIIAYRKEYLRLIHGFEDMFIHESALTSGQTSVIRRYFNLANFLTKGIWYPSLLIMFFVILDVSPPTDRDRDRDFVPAWESSTRITIPFQTADSPFYAVRVAYSIVASFLAYYIAVIMNTFVFLLIIYTSAQFALLAETLNCATRQVRDARPGTPRLQGSTLSCSPQLNAKPMDGELKAAGPQRADKKKPKLTDGYWYGGQSNLNPADEEWRDVGEQETEYDELFHREMQLYLNRCIQHHQKLLKNAKILNDLLSPIMFTQILSAGILIGVMGFTLANAKHSSEFLHSAGYITHLLLETGMICWLADDLTTQSEMVGEGAYCCDWFKEPVRFQRSINILKIRARRVVQLSIGPLGTISLELFSRILNSSYSYFTIMREMTD